MAGMGPPPKPADQRRRRNAPLANTVQLPSEGRKGDPPAWPLSCEEPAVWAELWRKPQAVMWERQGAERVVARYCVTMLAAEESLSAQLLAEVRQMEQNLGLHPMSLLRLRWEVVADEVADERSEREAAKERAPKRRLKVVNSDAVGS